MTVFDGRYRMIKRLGSGGMAEVWLARDEKLGDRQVAIKVMQPHVLADEDGVRRFHQEMALASRMQHPGIVTLFTSGTENGIPFMVMEYLQGHDLTNRPPGWGVGEVTRLGQKVFAALAYAHGLGVVHRDIKPGNLFLCDTGEVKVADFGIAKALTKANASQPGTGIGTSEYMAPEQWLEKPATFAIDVWATGCVLYEFLSGRKARHFPPGSNLKYYEAARRGDRVPRLASDTRVPSWLADAVMTMLEPDPASRPTAAQGVQLLAGPPAPAWSAGISPAAAKVRERPAGPKSTRDGARADDREQLGAELAAWWNSLSETQQAGQKLKAARDLYEMSRNSPRKAAEVLKILVGVRPEAVAEMLSDMMANGMKPGLTVQLMAPETAGRVLACLLPSAVHGIMLEIDDAELRTAIKLAWSRIDGEENWWFQPQPARQAPERTRPRERP